MIDEVKNIIPGKSGDGYKHLKKNSWFYKCHFVLLEDVKKTEELNFDQHEELITELHPLKNLRKIVAEKKITHSIGLNAILMLLLHLGM